MWWRVLCCGKNHFYPKMISLGAFSHSFCRQKIWTVARSLETPILYIVAKRSLKNSAKIIPKTHSQTGGGSVAAQCPPPEYATDADSSSLLTCQVSLLFSVQLLTHLTYPL